MLQIVTDSSSNISQAEAARLGITVLPLSISFGSDVYRDGVDIDTDAFYRLLRTNKNHPHTSQINPSRFEEIFFEAKENGDTLLLLPISASISGTYSAAITAKESVGYDGIYVYDVRGVSVILKVMVEKAVELRDEGKAPEEIMAALGRLRDRTELYASLDTLEYLYRGGRLKRGAAVLGTIFHIKPLITITKAGEVSVCGKPIGTKQAMRGICKLVVPEEIDDAYPVYYIYTENAEVCGKLLAEVTPDRPELLESATNICPVIGVHIGPNAVGIVFVRKAK